MTSCLTGVTRRDPCQLLGAPSPKLNVQICCILVFPECAIQTQLIISKDIVSVISEGGECQHYQEFKPLSCRFLSLEANID